MEMSIRESKIRGQLFPLVRSNFSRGGKEGVYSIDNKMQRPFDRLSSRISDFLNRSGQNLEAESKFACYFSSKNKKSMQNISSNSISLFGSTDSLTSVGLSEFGELSIAEKENQTGEGLPLQNESLLSTNQNTPNELHGMELLEVSKRLSNASPDTDLSSMSIFSMQEIMQRKNQLEMDCIKRRIQAREQFFSDKILLLRKTLEKQCNDASLIAEEQRQLASKLQQDLRSLSSEFNQVTSDLQNEKRKTGLLDDRIRQVSDQHLKGELLLQQKEALLKDLEYEKSEISKQTELLRKDFHRLKLELHLKETKLDSLAAEYADAVKQHAEETEQIQSKFKLKLENLENDQSLLAEELEEERKAKKHLEENLAESRRKHKLEFEQQQEEFRALEESNEAKLKSLECQLFETEQEKKELLTMKRELEMKLVELEIMHNSHSSDQPHLETILQLRNEASALRILLKDAQLASQANQKLDFENKAIIRKLKTSLEVAESEKSQIRQIQSKAESDLQDTMNQLNDVTRREAETLSFNRKLGQESVKLLATLEETKVDFENVLKTHNSTLGELAADKAALADQLNFNKALSHDNEALTLQVAQLNKKLQLIEATRSEKENTAKKEFYLRIGELKSKFKVDEIKQRRTEDALEKTKSELESAQHEVRRLSVDKKTANRLLKLAEKQGRDAAQQHKAFAYKLDESNAKKAKLEKLYEISCKEADSLRDELRAIRQRLEAIKEAKIDPAIESSE